MKSYLPGNPELRLALNENLVIGDKDNSYAKVFLNDCNFSECADTKDFGVNKILRIKPPEG